LSYTCEKQLASSKLRTVLSTLVASLDGAMYRNQRAIPGRIIQSQSLVLEV